MNEQGQKQPCFFNVKTPIKGSGTNPKIPILLIHDKKKQTERVVPHEIYYTAWH